MLDAKVLMNITSIIDKLVSRGYTVDQSLKIIEIVMKLSDKGDDR